MENTAKHKGIYKASTANPEFLFVLHKVVMALQQAMQHDKLPDLTPEQMSDWFKSIEPERISCVIQAIKEGTKEHDMLMKAWAKIAEGAHANRWHMTPLMESCIKTKRARSTNPRTGHLPFRLVGCGIGVHDGGDGYVNGFWCWWGSYRIYR